METSLKDLSTFLEFNSAAVVTAKEGEKDVVKGVVTKFDVVKFMVALKHKQDGGAPSNPSSPKKAKHAAA